MPERPSYERRSPDLTIDAAAVCAALFVLFLMYWLPSSIIASGKAGAVWACHAAFGGGIVGLAVILHLRGKYQ